MSSNQIVVPLASFAVRRASLVAGLLLATLATPCVAQSRYTLAHDTLRFHQVTRGDITLVTPQGDVAMKSEHDATVALARTAGDTARGWYDALSIGVTSPMGDQKPSTATVLRAPFTLRLDARGRVKLIAAPTFPASFQNISDLSRQFDDFLLRLPEAPLRVGLAWSDTLLRTDSTSEKFARWRSVATYRVERDTVVDGVPALVVSMKQRIEISADAPIPEQSGMRAESVLAGNDEGFFVFAPKAGRLVGRRRSGRIEGDLTMRGAQGEMAMKQSFAYTETIDAVK